ncbi:3-oxoacyl-[acyl-carrier-protein] reductase [Candidatus Bathyarchaeota archaeon]|nr:MAG: 3-oxoacyl-[acyl-carrier-protein] reductase [Candidatus Bathyarchaeota archaeon]
MRVGIANISKRKSEAKVNKVALVTGSSRGIGRAIAIELAKSGIDIVVNNSKNPQEGLEVVEEIKKIGQHAMYIQADVSNPDQVEDMIERIIKEFSRIDILINNAGIVMDKKLENMDIDRWNKVISVNLTGTFNCTKAVIKYMKKQGGGKIVNISSVVGEIGNFGQSNYAASKGGVISFTKTVAKEYAKEGIIVNAVAPGFIKTKMVEGIPEGIMQKILEQIPLGRLGEPEEVAKLVCFLVSDDVNYITGQVININGGMYM